MSKGHRNQKSIKDASSSTEKIVTSKTGSWIDQLEAKQQVEETTVVETKQTVSVKTSSQRRQPSHYPSHHKGHGKQSSTVCVSLDGGKTVQKMSRSTADKLVAQGKAQYASKTLWREGTKTVVQDAVNEFDPKVKKVATKKTK